VTRVVINQSAYIPWKGYFDLIRDADVFVFFDDAQFSSGGWRNRNRIKTNDGVKWLTIPVGPGHKQRICDIALPDASWQTRHWKTLRQFLGRAPFFGHVEPLLWEVYAGHGWETLSQLNQHLVRTIARDFLGIRTRIVSSADYPSAARGSERVLELVRAVGGTSYLSGPAGKAYLDEASFAAAGIALQWKDYAGYPEYPQLFPPFEHAVSIVDLIAHTGPEAARYVWGWRESRQRQPLAQPA
jgi:WbqC-like protein